MHRAPARPLIAVLAVLAALSLPGEAAAAESWSVGGSFAEPATPVLGGAVDRPTTGSLAFDGATSTLTLQLGFASPPSRESLHVVAGDTQPDGSCRPAGIAIDIAAQDHVVTTTSAVTTTTWIPQTTETGWSWSDRYPPGSRGWTLIGYDRWTMRYQWLHTIPGHWVEETHDVTTTGPDLDRHERIAGLSLDSADGVLDAPLVADDGATAFRWSFASPLLDGAFADCIALRIANRRGTFVVAAAQPDAAPSVTGASMRSRHRGRTAPHLRTLRLRFGGTARVVQLRLGSRRTGALPFARSLLLRVPGPRLRTIQVRFGDGRRWSAWTTVQVR